MTLVPIAAFLTSDWYYTQTKPALKNAFCFEQCQPCTHSVSVCTWSLNTQAVTCWCHLNCDPQVCATLSQKMLSLQEEWKSTSVWISLPLGLCKMHTSLPSLSQLYTVPREIFHNSQFSKCLLSGTPDILWGHQDRIVPLSLSGGQYYGGKRHVIIRDTATASVELHFWDV